MIYSPLDDNVSIYTYKEWKDKEGIDRRGYTFLCTDTLRNVLINNDQADKILQVRSGDIKKSNVPTYTPAGVWAKGIKRNADIPPDPRTNQVQIDIDGSANPGVVLMKDDLFDRFKSITAIGTSVSGNGVFILFNTDGIDYESSFRAICVDLEEYSLVIDDSVSSINELRFMTINNEVTVREFPEIYTKKIQKRKATVVDSLPTKDGSIPIPQDSVFHYRDATRYVGKCNSLGISKDACLYELNKSGIFDSKSHLNNNTPAIIELIDKMYTKYPDQFNTRKPQVSVNEAIKKNVKKVNEDTPAALYEFWSVDKNNIIKINAFKLRKLIENEGGFFLYKYDNQHIIIRNESGIISIPSVVDIKHFVSEYVIKNYSDDEDLLFKLNSAITNNVEKLFSKSNLELLSHINLNFLQHTIDAAYYPFKNGVMKITSDEKTLIPYNEVKMHVWKTHIIDHEFDNECEYSPWDTDFLKFIQKICNDDDERIAYTSGIIGYLLHCYKDPTRPLAIILAEEVEDDENGGGTGKGIFFRAISKLLKTVVIDGKTFKPDKPFLFQRVNIDTKIIVIDDCRKNIDFQTFYSFISEGLTVERKNKDEIHIPYTQSPKFIFSTNYTLNIDGTHGKRRAKTIEFSNFFNKENTPIDYFGHMLFDGWSEKQWNDFYSIMFVFLQNYLAEGINHSTESNSIIRKQVCNRFSKEFLTFWDDIGKDIEWQVVSDAYEEFLNSSGYEKREYSQRRFGTALRFACEKFGYNFVAKKNSLNKGRLDFKIIKIPVNQS